MPSDAKYDARKNKIEGIGLKILSPKQMLQRLPIALAQVKAGNNSESLLNEIRQIFYFLYQLIQIPKKVYNIKSTYNNNKFKISTPTWNDQFELPILYQIYKIILSMF